MPHVWIKAFDAERKQEHELWLPEEVASVMCTQLVSAVDGTDEEGTARRLAAKLDRAKCRTAVKRLVFALEHAERVRQRKRKGAEDVGSTAVSAGSTASADCEVTSGSHHAPPDRAAGGNGADVEAADWLPHQVGPRPFHYPMKTAVVHAAFAVYIDLLVLADRRDGSPPQLRLQM